MPPWPPLCRKHASCAQLWYVVAAVESSPDGPSAAHLALVHGRLQVPPMPTTSESGDWDSETYSGFFERMAEDKRGVLGDPVPVRVGAGPVGNLALPLTKRSSTEPVRNRGWDRGSGPVFPPPSSKGTCGSSRSSSASDEEGSGSSIWEALSPEPDSLKAPRGILTPPRPPASARKPFIAPKPGWWDQVPEGEPQGSSGLFPQRDFRSGGQSQWPTPASIQQPGPVLMHCHRQRGPGSVYSQINEPCPEREIAWPHQPMHKELIHSNGVTPCCTPGWGAGGGNGGLGIHRASRAYGAGPCVCCAPERPSLNALASVQGGRVEDTAGKRVDNCALTRLKDALCRFFGCVMPGRNSVAHPSSEMDASA